MELKVHVVESVGIFFLEECKNKSNFIPLKQN